MERPQQYGSVRREEIVAASRYTSLDALLPQSSPRQQEQQYDADDGEELAMSDEQPTSYRRGRARARTVFTTAATLLGVAAIVSVLVATHQQQEQQEQPDHATTVSVGGTSSKSSLKMPPLSRDIERTTSTSVRATGLGNVDAAESADSVSDFVGPPPTGDDNDVIDPLPAMTVSSLQKMTWAASSPQFGYAFSRDVLNATGNAVEGAENRELCATQVKVQVSNMQLHWVNATARPAGSMSIHDFEFKFAARLGQLTELDAFMEFNVGFWVSDLDHYTRHLQQYGYNHLPLRWRCPTTNATYYSVVAWIGGTSSVLEFIGESLTVATAVDTETVRLYDPVKYAEYMADELAAGAPQPSFVVVKISHPTVAADFAARWMERYLGASLMYTTEPNSLASAIEQRHVVTLQDENFVQWHWVDSNADATKGLAGAADKLSVSEWEQYMNALSAATIPSPDCGFNQYLDFHTGIQPPTLTVSTNASSNGPPGGGSDDSVAGNLFKPSDDSAFAMSMAATLNNADAMPNASDIALDENGATLDRYLFHFARDRVAFRLYHAWDKLDLYNQVSGTAVVVSSLRRSVFSPVQPVTSSASCPSQTSNSTLYVYFVMPRTGRTFQLIGTASNPWFSGNTKVRDIAILCLAMPRSPYILVPVGARTQPWTLCAQECGASSLNKSAVGNFVKPSPDLLLADTAPSTTGARRSQPPGEPAARRR